MMRSAIFENIPTISGTNSTEFSILKTICEDILYGKLPMIENCAPSKSLDIFTFKNPLKTDGRAGHCNAAPVMHHVLIGFTSQQIVRFCKAGILLACPARAYFHQIELAGRWSINEAILLAVSSLDQKSVVRMIFGWLHCVSVVKVPIFVVLMKWII